MLRSFAWVLLKKGRLHFRSPQNILCSPPSIKQLLINFYIGFSLGKYEGYLLTSQCQPGHHAQFYAESFKEGEPTIWHKSLCDA